MPRYGTLTAVAAAVLLLTAVGAGAEMNGTAQNNDMGPTGMRATSPTVRPMEPGQSGSAQPGPNLNGTNGQPGQTGQYGRTGPMGQTGQYESNAAMGDQYVDPALRRRNLEEAMSPRNSKSRAHTQKQNAGQQGNASTSSSDAESQNTVPGDRGTRGSGTRSATSHNASTHQSGSSSQHQGASSQNSGQNDQTTKQP